MEQLHYTIYKAQLLLEPTASKILMALFLSFVSFFFGDLYNDALIAVVMLMVMDTLLGIIASYKCGQIITSRRFANALLKGIIYFTAISAAYFTDLTIPYHFIQSTMIGFVGVTEFISILENIGKMGYRTPKKLLNQLRDIRSMDTG